jgi:hypothetical protein
LNTTQAIALKKAEARFTRAKAAVTETPTLAKEKAYQKAKSELASLRIGSRSTRTPHARDGYAVATPTTLQVQTIDPKKGS